MGDNNKMICRVCEATEDLCDLFAKENEDLLVMLESVANIYLHKDDFMPHMICADCTIRLNSAYSFINLCEKTERKLRDENYAKQEIAHAEPKNISAIEEMTVEYLEPDGVSPVAEIDENNSVIEKLGMIIPKEEIFSDDNETSDGLGSESSLNLKDPLINDESIKSEDITTTYDDFSDCSKDKEVKKNVQRKSSHRTNVSRQANVKDQRIIAMDRKRPRPLTSCYICPAVFTTRVDFEKHILEAHKGRKPYSCPICSKEYTRYAQVKEHIKRHDSGYKNMHLCKLCDKKYSCLGNLYRHYSSAHEKTRNYVCDECGKAFNRSDQLDYHRTVHIQEKTFGCDVCDKKFKLERQVIQHKRLHDPAQREAIVKKRNKYIKREDGNHKCIECGQQLSNIFALKMHMNTHTGEKPFVCKTCGKAFFSYGGMHTHRQIHIADRRYRCEICGKSYRQSCHLKRHIQVHSDDTKPFKCEICPSAYTSNQSLKIHIRTHTGERPFKCSFCEKLFIDNGSLKKHKCKLGRTNETVTENNETKVGDAWNEIKC